jgi:carbon-monoxide dehydrogenase small subunit
MSQHALHLSVNGEPVDATVPARRMLSDFLRDDLHLTGTKRGCETGTCGACTVLVDGRAVKSCLSLAVQAQGASVTTVEGLSDGDTLHPVQQAFLSCGGLQCGYCTPGFMMTSVALLKETPKPTPEQIRSVLNGHLCRCTGYSQIVESVIQASENTHGH